MPNHDFNTPKVSLAFAKIVPTPSTDSWSQVYNAGSFFAVLSITQTNPDNTEISLPAIGKNIFNDLEAEFFSLQEKNHKTIQSVIEKSLGNTDSDIQIDASIAYFKNNILYLFLVGKGKAIIKRDGKIGTILDKKTPTPKIRSSSGYLMPGDTILFQTDHFTKNIPMTNITQALELQLPSDIAESLSPYVHQKENGAQAAIIITYNGGGETLPPQEQNAPIQPNPSIPFASEKENIPKPSSKKPSLKIPKLTLARRQKIAIITAVIIIIVLAISIIASKTSQENAKNQTRYQQILASVQKDYDEGKELNKINQTLAREDLIKAKQTIEKNIQSFKEGSEEKTNLQALLKQIENELNTSSTPVEKITPKSIELEKNHILSIQKDNNALAYAQDNALIYMLTSKAIITVDKTTGEKKEILNNNKDWTSAVALSSYLGNLYILEAKNNLLKFAAAQNGFGKTQYFKQPPTNLTNARAMAIDGSVWILTGEGKVFKYTSGNPDTFAITGLTAPMKNPTRIFTDVEIDNLYILDNGNARILKFTKNGQLQDQYRADILAHAKDFQINESDQKAHILSNNKTYELPLN
jgi:hypothetical protein